MHTKILPLIAILFLIITSTFAQSKQPTDKAYQQMISFQLYGKTWVYHQEFDHKGKTPEHPHFFSSQKKVLQSKGNPLKALPITEQERKTLKQERRPNPPTHWLTFDIPSSDAKSHKCLIQKANAYTLVIDYRADGQYHQVIFKAKN